MGIGRGARATGRLSPIAGHPCHPHGPCPGKMASVRNGLAWLGKGRACLSWWATCWAFHRCWQTGALLPSSEQSCCAVEDLVQGPCDLGHRGMETGPALTVGRDQGSRCHTGCTSLPADHHRSFHTSLPRVSLLGGHTCHPEPACSPREIHTLRGGYLIQANWE